VGIKSWFGGGGSKQTHASKEQEYTIDDLIVLERYDEAADRLKAKLKVSPQDLHTHLRLAEVYAQLRQFDKAVDEFGFVAEEYAQDGFHDKGVALLSKAQKLAPLDQTIRFKIEKIQREKSMEAVRGLALEGLRQAGGGGTQAGTSALEMKKLWHHLAASSIVQQLPGEQLKKVFSSMKLVRYDTGAVIAEEGERESFLLLIVIGLIEAVTVEAGREMVVRTFTSGDIIGEGPLLERLPWPVRYRAGEPATALKLTREGLEQVLVGNPDPRGLIEILRGQHNDRDLAATVRRLRSS